MYFMHSFSVIGVQVWRVAVSLARTEVDVVTPNMASAVDNPSENVVVKP